MKTKHVFIALLIAMLFITGCTSTTKPIEEITPKAEVVAVAQPIKVEAPVAAPVVAEEEKISEPYIASISKYGNCMTNLDYKTLESEGILIGDIYTITLGSLTFEAPVVTNYSDVDLGKYLVKVSEKGIELAINMGNLAKAAGIDVNAPFTYELKEKGGYADAYMIRHLEKSESREDYSTDEIFANFRAVKAGGIKEGKLYRSCNPILDDARAPYAATLVEQAGIKAVMNLADSKESAEKQLSTAPYYESLYNDGKVITLDMGVDFYSEDFTSKLKDGLLFLADQKAPVLVHCNEGKDREGVVVGLLDAISGASMDEIVADYMISYENYYGVEKGTEQYAKISSVIKDFFKSINNGEEVSNKQPLAVAVKYLKDGVGLSINDITSLRLLLR